MSCVLVAFVETIEKRFYTRLGFQDNLVNLLD